jgi:small subunit ribosomal protein S9
MAKKKAVHAEEGKKKEKKGTKGIIFKVGRRRMAVAKATVRPGAGKILVNGEPLENLKNDVLRLRMEEPFILTEKNDWKAYDFTASARGGGSTGQADAVRQAFARALVEIFGAELKQKFSEYDRNLLVYDPRRTEPHKPPRSSQGPRRYKQRSKR